MERRVRTSNNAHHRLYMHRYCRLALLKGAKVVFSIGFLMNSFLISAVMTAMQRSQYDFRVQNVFIVNLAVSDLCLGKLVVFFINLTIKLSSATISTPFNLYLALYYQWTLGEFACRIMGSFQAFNTSLSCLTLVGIAAARFALMNSRNPNVLLACFLA